MNTKEAIREKIRAKRRAIPPAQRRRESLLLHDKLVSMDEYQSSKTIGLYAGSDDEVMTAPLIARALGAGKKVAMPRVEGEKLGWRWITSIADLEPGSFSILEPKSKLPKAMTGDIEMIVLPGIAFDNNGHRLGYGMGFYDKDLAGYEGLTIALAFDCQLVEDIPSDRWDLPVSKVITPHD